MQPLAKRLKPTVKSINKGRIFRFMLEITLSSFSLLSWLTNSFLDGIKTDVRKK